MFGPRASLSLHCPTRQPAERRSLAGREAACPREAGEGAEGGQGRGRNPRRGLQVRLRPGDQEEEEGLFVLEKPGQNDEPAHVEEEEDEQEDLFSSHLHTPRPRTKR